MTQAKSLVEDMASIERVGRAVMQQVVQYGPDAVQRYGRAAIAEVLSVLKDRLPADDRELVERAILGRLREEDGTQYTRGFNNGVRGANVVAGQALADRIIAYSASSLESGRDPATHEPSPRGLGPTGGYRA